MVQINVYLVNIRVKSLFWNHFTLSSKHFTQNSLFQFCNGFNTTSGPYIKHGLTQSSSSLPSHSSKWKCAKHMLQQPIWKLSQFITCPNNAAASTFLQLAKAPFKCISCTRQVLVVKYLLLSQMPLSLKRTIKYKQKKIAELWASPLRLLEPLSFPWCVSFFWRYWLPLWFWPFYSLGSLKNIPAAHSFCLRLTYDQFMTS